MFYSVVANRRRPKLYIIGGWGGEKVFHELVVPDPTCVAQGGSRAMRRLGLSGGWPRKRHIAALLLAYNGDSNTEVESISPNGR